jgi:dTDP-4-dehydrorhamnose 3,5-epimerase
VIFTSTEIEGAYVVDLDRLDDERGFFARSWCRQEFTEQGLVADLVQANIAFTRHQGTLRGMHYQATPHEEAKLVRCTRGAAYVVALDLRRSSPSWTRWISAELTADNRRALYVPPGCAQGYQTLVDDTEAFYQMSSFYTPKAAKGVRYDDPQFKISWPLPVTMISDRDRDWPDYPLQPS